MTPKLDTARVDLRTAASWRWSTPVMPWLWILQLAVAASVAVATACPQECSCTSKITMCTAVTNDFNNYASSLPATQPQLLVNCELAIGMTRPLPGGNRLSRLNSGVFRRFAELKTIIISNCPLRQLPPLLFSDLPQLESVTLDNLLFESLPPSLFNGSRKLSELMVLNNPLYRRQEPGLLVGTRMHHVTLTLSSLDAEQLGRLLAGGRRTMISVQVKQNQAALAVPERAFADFKLDKLALTACGISNFSFAASAGSATVDLAYNHAAGGRVDFGGGVGGGNARVRTLRLSRANLRELPAGLAAFPRLRELFLSGNSITRLPADRISGLRELRILDLADNHLQTLRWTEELETTLRRILYHKGSALRLVGNPIHCNCEIGWLLDSAVLHSNAMANVKCATGQRVGELLSEILRRSLHCRRPRDLALSLRVSGSAAPVLGSQASVPEAELRPGQNATLLCSATADPAPTLRLLADGREVAVSRRSDDASQLNASLALAVQQRSLRSPELLVDCLADNGRSEAAKASLRIVNAGFRASTPTPTPNRTDSPDRIGDTASLPAAAKLLMMLTITALLAIGFAI